MAVYTTSLEVIVNNLCEDRYDTLQNRIESARPKIFNFDYPCPNTIIGQDFKKYFETTFINKYLFREIAQETVAKFQQRVYYRTLEVMPKYKVIFDILENLDTKAFFDNYNFHEVRESENHTVGESSGVATGESTGSSTTGSKSAGSNLPENMLATGTIGNFTNVGYADNASIANTEGTSKGESLSESEGHDKRDTTNKETVTHTGRTMSQFEALRALDSNFNEYFERLLREYSDLFMVLYF